MRQIHHLPLLILGIPYELLPPPPTKSTMQSSGSRKQENSGNRLYISSSDMLADRC